jgi:hypothetical protein
MITIMARTNKVIEKPYSIASAFPVPSNDEISELGKYYSVRKKPEIQSLFIPRF